MKTFTGSDPLFIDTWGWLVLSNDKDPNYRHVRSLREQAAEMGTLWITTDYVLDETFTRLFAARPFSRAREFAEAIFTSERLGSLVIERIGSERFASAWKLRLRYHDKPRISFTDLTSFVVMREAGIRRVLTGDAHFNQIGFGFQIVG